MEESNIKKVLDKISRKKRIWDERSTQVVETVNMYMTRYANIRDSYNEQYPAFFELDGHVFVLKITRRKSPQK